MESLCNDGESASECHNKNRKDYQAQITFLKKQAKSNKKNKKDLLLEIAKLEKEFQEATFEEKDIVSKDTDSSTIDNVLQNVNQRVSRAQKRRDKKVLNERERAIRIEEQEEINKHGLRHKESLAIKTILKSRNLCVHDIPSNGDCLYKAIEHQLIINDKKISGNELRKLTSDYLRENKIDFLPFMANTESGDLLTDSEYEDYCLKIENTNAWGGQIELKAISSALQATIEVLQAEGPPTIQGAEYKTKPLILTYHRHIFGLGEHYNSTEPKNEESETSD